MIFLIKNNLLKSSIIVSVVCFFIIIYFIVQTFVGKYGLATLDKKKIELQNLINQYEENKADLILYEQKVKALDINNIDPDVLEGEMKKQIYYTKPNEIMVILPKK
ncbi:MAG: FtsB family cell division protein [Rickettsiales bacterium]